MSKVLMTSAMVRLDGAASHAAIAILGIVLKRAALVLARHEISKSSAKAPTFLVYEFVVSIRPTYYDIDRPTYRCQYFHKCNFGCRHRWPRTIVLRSLVVG